MNLTKLSDLDRHVRQAERRAVDAMTTGTEPVAGDLALLIVAGTPLADGAGVLAKLVERAQERLDGRANRRAYDLAETAAVEGAAREQAEAGQATQTAEDLHLAIARQERNRR